MGKRKIPLKVNVPEHQLDPRIAQILADLREGELSKKEIANKNGVDLAVVCRVMKSDNFDPSQVKEKKEGSEIDHTMKFPLDTDQQTLDELQNHYEENEMRGGGIK